MLTVKCTYMYFNC